MRFMEKGLYTALIVALMVVFCEANGWNFIEWTKRPWKARDIAFVTTIGLAQESRAVRDLWEKCYSHSLGSHLTDIQCHEAIVSAITRWGLEIGGLAVISGWWKPHEDDMQMISLGGLTGIRLDSRMLTFNSTVGDVPTLHFSLSNTTIIYQPIMLDDMLAGNVDLVLFGTDDKDGQSVKLLEANNNGTWMLNVLEDFSTKNECVYGLQYVKGSGGTTIECHYGENFKTDIGESRDRYESTYENMSQEDLMSSGYRLFQGYASDSPRVKCAFKVYENDERAAVLHKGKICG